jgi:hypothetical protein
MAHDTLFALVPKRYILFLINQGHAIVGVSVVFSNVLDRLNESTGPFGQMKTLQDRWKMKGMGIHDFQKLKKGPGDGFVGTHTGAIRIKRRIDVFIGIESSLVPLPFKKTGVDFFFDGMNVIS